MTRITQTLIACAASALPIAALATPGYQTQTIDVAHRDQALELHIWYPTDALGEITQLGKNAVFKGVPVQQGATSKEGAHPLVVLSHGSGGNAANLAWIAASLAERGMVVVGPNHPGTTSRDSLQSETIKIWERPADISAVIDHAFAKWFCPGCRSIPPGSVPSAFRLAATAFWVQPARVPASRGISTIATPMMV